MPDSLLTTAQAAAVLCVSERRVRALCAQGRLGQRVGRTYAIAAADLARFRQRPRKPGRPWHNGTTAPRPSPTA